VQFGDNLAAMVGLVVKHLYVVKAFGNSTLAL
jgi:hypothetical protein